MEGFGGDLEKSGELMAMFVTLVFFSDESSCGEKKKTRAVEGLYTAPTAAGTDIRSWCLSLKVEYQSFSPRSLSHEFSELAFS